MKSVEGWHEVGDRVREARLACGLSQVDLARRLDIDRTALVRVEAGGRQVTALELFRLAEILDVPITYFVTRPPAAVVSQRTSLTEDADAASRTRFKIDATLESHAEDTRWLIGKGVLLPESPIPAPTVKDRAGAERLAAEARRSANVGTGPIGGMAEFAEHFGLYMVVVDQDVDGASLFLDDFGVAVVGGRRSPGRRRFTAAHELGHHLLQDPYHTDVGVASSTQEREAIIDAFAADLLLPPAALNSISTSRPREDLIRVAGTYRVSWSVVMSAVERAGAVTADRLARLRAETPVKGEFIAVLGESPTPDLEIGGTGPGWRRAVLEAWDRSLITAERTIELLRQALTVDELPPRTHDRDAL